MSRARHQDSENSVQLFPFVAVLLCTMGSLLVILIGVAKSAKERGEQEATAQRAAAQAAAAARSQADLEKIAAAQRELAEIAKYKSELDAARAQAAEQLRQNQSRLSHLEDHMRRLREQLATLQLAAAELNALEGSHFDDREQAKREVERLQQLIAESEKTIEELRAEAKSRSKSFAIVPYQGHRGTRRRPIYIECTGEDVVLQPEGVHFTADDFRPPIGPGNPLVAALRAAREYVAQYEAGDASGTAAVPYPLIIVRPKGVRSYYLVREAIQSWDSEFGYELVEQDWQLKYAPANPQLAVREQEAADLARARLQALAEAAPQAYGAYRFGDGGGGGFGHGFGYGGGYSGDGGGGEELGLDDAEGTGGSPQRPRGERLASLPGGSRAVVVINRGEFEKEQTGGDVKASPTQDRGDKPGGGETSRAADSSNPALKVGGGPDQGSNIPPSQQSAYESLSSGGRAATNDNPEQQLDDMARAAAASDQERDEQQRSKQNIRGKNWAIRSGGQGEIPIRRTIQIVVRDDAVAILPEASSTNDDAAAGREYKFGDAPEAAYEDLLAAVDKRIDNWGIAGQGLYWRPVVELKVGADGDHRLDELLRLLNHSGADVRNGSMADRYEGGTSGKSR